ncbi:MAG TPA: hypothetical protein VG675_25045 [Bryobacteraceae bacterium]|nr:hypothetical protein [Bryobacteraceae bacterium]
MKLIVMALAVAGFAFPAGELTGVHVWKSSELKGYAKILKPKMSAQKVASEQLGNTKNHSFMMAYREASGGAEYHANKADILIVEDGEATLVYGGDLVNGKQTSATEMMGTSIKGGTETKIATGDIVHVPPKTPHQMLLAPGAHINYFVVKVDQ